MRFLFLLIFINTFHLISGQIVKVNNQTTLDDALNNAVSGDTILIEKANSPYNDLNITINKDATSESPIVIMAEDTEVTLTGNSQVKIGGSFIVFEGFKFGGNLAPDDLIGDGVIEFRASSSSTDWCNNCTVKNIEFDGHNQSSSLEKEKLKWIRVYGQDNEIANCTFNNKKGVGNCITVERSDVIENRTLIHHNYFANRVPIIESGKVLNDQDAMRIGYSGTSLTDASCQIYNNYFYNWDGEVEIISNKSNKNKYYNNTFRKCVGTLTLRHGTHCEVFGNFFFGENISKSGGVRVIDSDHKIYNNYFQDLNTGGSKVVGAINLFKGDDDFVTDGQLNSYAICEDNLIAHNTIVNCDKGIWIGPDDSGREYAPKNLEILNNIMVKCDEAALVGTAPIGTNIIAGNIKEDGTWWSGFSNSDNLETDSDLTSPDDYFERIKQGNDAIGYAVSVSSFIISQDITQGQRDANADAGAEEYNSSGSFLPYSSEDVGIKVGVIKTENTTTGFNKIDKSEQKSFDLYPIPAKNYLTFLNKNTLNKKVSIYTISGKLVKSKNIINGEQESKIDLTTLEAGTYMFMVEEGAQIGSQIFIKN